MSKPRPGARRRSIFAVPLALGLASVAGLIAGLIDDGLFDLLAWIGLGSAVGAMVWSLYARRA